ESRQQRQVMIHSVGDDIHNLGATESIEVLIASAAQKRTYYYLFDVVRHHCRLGWEVFHAHFLLARTLHLFLALRDSQGLPCLADWWGESALEHLQNSEGFRRL